MASYNLVNGIAASENPYLLTEILRNAWRYDGVVVSDWFWSVKSTAASVNAGLDLEMPEPQWRGEKLLQAVERGEVEEATIDTSVRRLLQLVLKAGLFEQQQEEPEQGIDLPKHRTLIREAGAEGCVLLRNEQQVLPLQREHLTSIAVIGPNAQVAQIMGGGSAQVNAHYAITPLEGITNKVGDHTTVRYEQGCTNHKYQPLLDMSLLLAGREGSEQGLAIEYFNNSDVSGTAVLKETKTTSELMWFSEMPKGVDPKQFSFRATGRFTPRQTGDYTLGMVNAGPARFSLDGRVVIDTWNQPTAGADFLGAPETQETLSLQAGRIYLLTLEYAKSEEDLLAMVRLGCLPPQQADAIERASALAASSDVAIVCVGFGGEWQSEGFDRPNMNLPGEQDALVEQVAAANTRTIVVLNTGSPISMPWLEKVAAVVQAWYPGQECGNAIADVLFGTPIPVENCPRPSRRA